MSSWWGDGKSFGDWSALEDVFSVHSHAVGDLPKAGMDAGIVRHRTLVAETILQSTCYRLSITSCSQINGIRRGV